LLFKVPNESALRFNPAVFLLNPSTHFIGVVAASRSRLEIAAVIDLTLYLVDGVLRLLDQFPFPLNLL
jgi:hypothetical protein